MEKVVFERKINKMADLAGIQRFKKMVSLFRKSESAGDFFKLYNKSITDCFELAKFSARLDSKGYSRYEYCNVEEYCNHLFEMLSIGKQCKFF
jgi:hypothetical protein